MIALGANENGASGHNAQKVVVMGLERGFLKRQMGHPVRKARKGKNAEYGASIVSQNQVLNLIY